MIEFIDRLLGRDNAQKAVVTGTGGTGPGVAAYYNDAPLWTVSRNPRRLMRQAQELYHDDLIIRAVEGKVSGKAAGLPWHLEDENDDEVTDESDPAAVAVRDWLEKPQGSLVGRKQMGRRELWKLTHRHNGLCGTTFWYLDQRTMVTGAPLVTLYINPARMYPAQDSNGNLLGWKLDSDNDGNGGLPLDLEEVLQFQFDPPDWGHYGIGLVESAGAAAALAKSIERHTSTVYSGGGRLAGLISPKVGATVSPDDWAAAVRDWRNIANDPDSAKRLHVLRGPVDFVRTAATMQELAVQAVSKMSRDDKLALWGVPESQLPLPTAVGLNSGDTKGYDEAVLMQGAVHDRITPFWEVIQYGVLDKIADAGGPKLQLIIEEPEFDDDTPNYDRAQKAGNIALTTNERRVSIGLDPLPDYTLAGEPLGTAIMLPSTLTLFGAGPDETGQLRSTPQPPPPPQPIPLEPSSTDSGQGIPAKAGPLGGLRKAVDTNVTPAIQKAVAAALKAQARDIAAKIRGVSKSFRPKDTSLWWNPKAEAARMEKAIRPHIAGIAQTVTGEVSTLLAKPAKADNFEERVVDFVTRRGTERIPAILETTRDSINRLIVDGFASGLGPAEVADSIETATAFDDARAELIARTESMLAYNEAALSGYHEFGVDMVQAIDGDQDEACAARDGQTFTVAEAQDITDHPNGTLDWAPVLAPTKAEVEPELQPAEDMVTGFKAALRSMADPPTVNVEPPVVNISPPVVNVQVDTTPFADVLTEIKAMLTAPREIVRDEKGNITGSRITPKE